MDKTKEYIAIGSGIALAIAFFYFGNMNGVATLLPPKTS